MPGVDILALLFQAAQLLFTLLHLVLVNEFRPIRFTTAISTESTGYSSWPSSFVALYSASHGFSMLCL